VLVSEPGGSLRQAMARAWTIAPGVFLAGIGGGIVFPILPLVGLQVGLPLAFIGLILASNRIGRIVFNPVAGALIDRYGGKRMMVVGLVLEVVVMGMYWLGVSDGHPGTMFLAGRLLWGPGSALAFVGGQTLALHAAGPELRGRVTGIVRAAMGLGTPSGLVVGGLVAGMWGDRAAFEVAMLAALVAAAVALRVVPDLRAPSGPRRPWSDVLRALADRRIAAVAGLNFMAFFAVQGVVLATLVLVVAARHLTLLGLPPETASGFFLAFMLCASAAVTPFAGRLADRGRMRAQTAGLGLCLMIPGFLVLALATDAGRLLGALVLIGIGSGCLSVPLLALLGDLVPPAMRGSAVGGLQLFGDGGGTLGPVLGTGALAALGLSAPYLIAAAILALGLPLAWWLRRAERRDRSGEAEVAARRSGT
jgi:MFS family permease